MRRKDPASRLEQARVVGRGAADPLAERHDFPVQVFELAARSALEALQGGGAVGAIHWEVARQPAPEQAVAERHRKRRDQPKGARPAALVEAEAAKLRRPDTFANRCNRQPCETWVAQRLSDGQP